MMPHGGKEETDMLKILEWDPALLPYRNDLELRMERYEKKLSELLPEGGTLSDFANAHLYYGIHRTNEGWVYREWAPAAEEVYLTGDFNAWHWLDDPMTRVDDNGTWEIRLPAERLWRGCHVRTIVRHNGELTEHIPLYAHRVVQDPENHQWSCEVVDGAEPFAWTDASFRPESPLFIYETHVGMAQEDGRVGTYREFADDILPRIVKAGYNTIQVMAVMEHPYYGSFGYQVSSFFAASSRYGLPEDLKYLINTAHAMGIRVLLDVVHSHAVKNTLEGINMFDGTEYQFFHAGPAGEHPAWGTKCFNYDKNDVLCFLLSNLKYWMEEYHFDGFRFDGVTSMLYHDHGLGSSFDSMDKYFSMNTDVEAITYLQLANVLVHGLNPHAVTIAEDMSGMPGMCVTVDAGGIGFDYRLSMGVPDLWIKLIKEQRDEDWSVGRIWSELVTRYAPTIAYAESHDQALVGDQTIMFRLAGAEMYTEMAIERHSMTIDRAMALHKLIRLLVMSAGGDGYLNFMGNEFGHPEWIDFPREGNGWSYHYCRRQWSLVDSPFLKYKLLNQFDRDAITLLRGQRILDHTYPKLLYIHEDDHVLAFERGGYVFIFNLDPTRSYDGYTLPLPASGEWQVILSTDDFCYGGDGRVAHERYGAFVPGMNGDFTRMYLPSRCAMVLSHVEEESSES